MNAGILFLRCLLILAIPTVGLAQTKALRFARLWDGAGRVWTAPIVVVKDTVIVSVSTDPESIPADAEEIDLSTFTAIPGLIDVHTHLTYTWDGKPGTTPLNQRWEATSALALAQENARKTLEAGVTTVRDLNAIRSLDRVMRDSINEGRMIGPRMFISGLGLSAGDGPPAPDELQRLARQRIAAGNDWVKLFASTGGFADVTGEQTMGFEAIKAAVDVTHSLGKRIAVHSYGPDAARDAVRAGADSIEHAVDIDDPTLAEMARRNIFYVPTIDHNRYYLENRHVYNFPPQAARDLEAFIERNLETARRAHKRGVRLAMGSDALFTMCGQNIGELAWFVKAGLTPEEALLAATANGAELLGMEDKLGRIRPGFIADVVAVEGDPLVDLTVLRTGVRWVMKDGSVVVDQR